MGRPADTADRRGSAAPRWVAFALAVAVFVGCQGTGKRTASPPPGMPASSDGRPFWETAGNRRATPPANVPRAGEGDIADVGGLLAGRVVDRANRSPGVAVVQVQYADDRDGKPIDVETNSQGFFTIRGLSPGRPYRLTVKADNDGRLLVGEAVAKPPDARLLIALNEESVRPSGATATPGPGAQLRPPRPETDYLPPPNPENIASNDVVGVPRANIPAPGFPDARPQWVPADPRGSGPTPDCLVSNGRVLTLRLTDPDGRVWDLAQTQGQLVLVDLCGTWCGPCIKAMPELIRLQTRYRSRGLEVIGVACEKNSHAANVAAVQGLRRRTPQLNYPLLIAGEPGHDPVRSQFRPEFFPTLILLDADGTVLWRGVGGDSIREADALIRARLGS